MKSWRRVVLITVTLAACVGCDQRTKVLAENYLRGTEAVSLFADTIRLDYTENPGAFLSLGASLPVRWRTAAFSAGVSAGLAALLVYALYAPESGFAQVLGLSMVCGGGLGNLVDRLMHGGYVRDFLNLGVGPVRTGIFNVADVAVMAGCLLLLTQRLRKRAH
jgi:signal peptidase II